MSLKDKVPRFCREDYSVSKNCPKRPDGGVLLKNAPPPPPSCVGVAVKGDLVSLIDTKGRKVIYTKQEFEIFIKGVKEGEFDLK